MKGCMLNSNMGAIRLLLGEAAFSYIFNFLRTAETISMNLGTNEVLKIPYKCCCITNNLHKILMTGVLCTVCGTLLVLEYWSVTEKINKYNLIMTQTPSWNTHV